MAGISKVESDHGDHIPPGEGDNGGMSGLEVKIRSERTVALVGFEQSPGLVSERHRAQPVVSIQDEEGHETNGLGLTGTRTSARDPLVLRMVRWHQVASSAAWSVNGRVTMAIFRMRSRD